MIHDSILAPAHSNILPHCHGLIIPPAENGGLQGPDVVCPQVGLGGNVWPAWSIHVEVRAEVMDHDVWHTRVYV